MGWQGHPRVLYYRLCITYLVYFPRCLYIHIKHVGLARWEGAMVLAFPYNGGFPNPGFSVSLIGSFTAVPKPKHRPDAR